MSKPPVKQREMNDRAPGFRMQDALENVQNPERQTRPVGTGRR